MCDVSGDGFLAGAGDTVGVLGDGVPVHPSRLPDPFAVYGELIRKAGEAQRAKHEAMVFGSEAEVESTGWASWEADADVVGFEMDYSTAWLLGFRLALRHYPHELSQHLDTLFALRSDWKAEQKRLDGMLRTARAD